MHQDGNRTTRRAQAKDQIRFCYCSVRPLIRSSAANTVSISRGHVIEHVPARDARPFALLSLIGGKWTTFWAFGAEAADVVRAAARWSRRWR